MTEVTLLCGKNGVINECKANGHACFSKKGSDIVCSAITILLKTSMQVLSHTEFVTFKADTSSRGTLAFSVNIQENLEKNLLLEVESRLRCVADFIRNGIKSLSENYPENVLLREILN